MTGHGNFLGVVPGDERSQNADQVTFDRKRYGSLLIALRDQALNA